MDVLRVSDVSKNFGSKKVISNVNFRIESGKIFGFLGPNGAGKTTMIKMILGLLKIDSGSIKINGFDVARRNDLALERVGGIIENPEFYGHLTGYQNLKQFAGMCGLGKEEIDRAISFVGMSERINEKVRTYSLGMKQRLGLAQAILCRPNLLVLDEPTNGLDPIGIKSLRDALKLLASEGTAVMVSSHQLSEMEQMCDCVGIIDNGRLVRIDTVENLMCGTSETRYAYTFRVSDVYKSMALLREINAYNLSGGVDSVSFLSTEAQASAVAKYILNNAIEIYSMTRETRTLEDVFIETTKRHITDVKQTERGMYDNEAFS